MKLRVSKKQKTWPKNLQTTQESGMVSTLTEKENGRSHKHQGLIHSGMLYHLSCQTIPYRIFVRITLGIYDLQTLIITGKPEEELLVKAWDDITSEFCETVKTERSKSLFEAWRKVKETESKMKTIAIGIDILRIKFDEETAQSIFLMGYDLVEFTEDKDEYKKRVDRLELETKNLGIFLSVQLAQYQALLKTNEVPKDQEVQLRTEADYDEDLAALSRFMGYDMDKMNDNFTAAKYGAALSLYIKQNEKAKRDGKGKGQH